MPTNEELRLLLQAPSESLSVEYKSWLDLSAHPGRANLAKAAIALANEGGGIIVLGMREAVADGGALRSTPRPNEIGRYSLDEVNNAIGRYADPQFHCELLFETAPDTSHEHAFVIVPGGMTVPVMSRRECEGVIRNLRCYVRKPGPRSEEPSTAEEWRGVLERCVQARRESMLDAIRIIVQGHGSPPAPPAAQNVLTDFMNSARSRWDALTADLPPNDDARMPHGHYELGFELIGVPAAASLTELNQRMDQASRIRLTGWGPFVTLSRRPFEPQPVAGNVETWLGQPQTDRMFRGPAHCDFWRASPSGLLFLLRGYDEDEVETVRPGEILDVTLPIWRVGEAMLYASRLALLFNSDPEILVRCRYTGLRGRRLGSADQRRHFSYPRVCADDEAEFQTTATARQIEDNLVEILHPMLTPLYERFGFFPLRLDMVRSEVERMRAGRF